MRMWRALAGVVVVALVALPACGGDDDDDAGSSPTSQASATTAPDAGEFDDYIGLAVEEAGAKAESEGRPWRVAREDGEDLALTMDFVENRLNFAVEDGIVVEVWTG